METATITTSSTSPVRRAAINALAVVGFIVLIIIGMALAVYAATFVPKAVTRLNGAAVYLSSLFVGSNEPAAIEVVTPGDTLPFTDTPGAGIATTTPVAETPAKPATAPAAVASHPGTPTYTVVTTTKPAPALFGLSDLTVAVVAKGYLTSADTTSFVKSDTVPNGERPAVKFSVLNVGTNASGRFDFTAKLPTRSSFTYTSDSQDSLLPGEHIDYVLGFDRARSGEDSEITITVDDDNDVAEINNSNNSVSVTLNIK